MTVHPFFASLIRTLVPIVAGTLLAWLARIGLDIDVAGEDALGTWFESLFIGAYYLVVRWVETKVPQVGWLLGLAKSPDSYSAAPVSPRHSATASR